MLSQLLLYSLINKTLIKLFFKKFNNNNATSNKIKL